MKVLSIDMSAGSPATAHGSQGVRRVRVHRGSGSAAVTVMRLEPGGRIGRHPATTPQILIVTQGQGWASGAEGEAEAVAEGQAACWAAGEEHETWTDTGMTVLVVEAESPSAESLFGEAARG
ncbi:hypothetical protein [Actinacidiphila acidipaludis]|uniref:Cupin n=1 Tax=Actinacidiphila acidipaludis TaxID=2873382 RepID=A0ABS7QD70_9ACTN|nr:hypothetical protein [Streptomyces acidipaludis]MBY8881111.1 hypothetical protein [Streptomyces acidipaludis]